MPFGFSDIVRNLVVPAGVALAVFVVWRRAGRLAGPSRYAGPHAVLAGFWAAWLLFEWSHLRPVDDWDWAPWLAVLAAISGPVALAIGVGRFDRVVLRVALAAVTAWALVPTWAALADVRLVHVGVLAAAIVALCLALEWLPARFSGAILPALLCASALAASGVLALSGSLKLAEMAGAAGAAMGGCALGAVRARGEPVFRGGTDVFAVLIGGLLYVGWVHSFSAVPAASYVLPAVAPVCLWACAAGPLARLSGGAQLAARLAVVFVPLALAVGLAVWFEPISDV